MSEWTKRGFIIQTKCIQCSFFGLKYSSMDQMTSNTGLRGILLFNLSAYNVVSLDSSIVPWTK